MTGALGGLCLWMIARAFQHPVIIQFGTINVAMYACFAPPLFLSAFLGQRRVFIGLASFYMDDADREWVGRAGGWILIAIAVWTVVNGLVIFGPYGLIWLWKNYEISQIPLVSTGIGIGDHRLARRTLRLHFREKS